MKALMVFLRLFVGILFIFSGLIKANDPTGLSYKMQEFFEIWHWDFLNDYTLPFAILMIGFEIIAGAAVLLGWQFRLFSWLLFLLIVFFTFLTGYAVLSGTIKECGCFGDCIKLTSGQSFSKDLLLFLVIGFMLLKKDQVKPILGQWASIFVLVLVTVASFWIQLYVLTHLPIVDCLPYKKGVSITEKMKIPADATPDSTVITFVYQYGGKMIEFDTEHFPADFNDSAYAFIKRYDKLIRQGNAQPAIKDFVVIAPSGTDTTAALLAQKGRILVLFAKTFSPNDHEWIAEFKTVVDAAQSVKMPVLAVSSDAENLIRLLAKQQIRIPVCKGDLVAIKTAARSNPTIYLLEEGRVIDKWGKANIHRIQLD